MKCLFRMLIAAIAMLGLAALSEAEAQGYPNKPITIIVPFGAGSATDTITRVVGQQLSVVLKQSVVIENRPGANGALAALYVAHAKANPGKLSYASGNTSGVVAGATLAHWAKIDLLHVPYKSAPPALQDLLAGRVSMAFNDFTTSIPHVRAKTLNALAVTRIKRSALFPELPTMDEAGVEGFDMDSWAGIFAPAKTPPAIVTQLNTELRKIIDSAETKGKLRAAGFEAFSSSPKELDDFVKVQLDKWGRMIADAGIKPE